MMYVGWGTALKPANEPICVARKPLSEKSVAENVLKWGTGGLNIDGCRVGTEGGTMRSLMEGISMGLGMKSPTTFGIPNNGELMVESPQILEMTQI